MALRLSTPLPSAQQTVEEQLARAASSPPELRDQIHSDVVLQHLALARSTAARYRDRGEPLDDLVQVASVGLVLAVKRFDPDAGVPFAAFAVPTMTGEIRRYFRDHGWAMRPPRRLQELRPQIATATETLTHELHRWPTDGEVAERLGVDQQEISEAHAASGAYHHLSLDLGADGPDGPVDTLAAMLGSDDERIPLIEDRLSVSPLMSSLSDRERRILSLRFFDGLTQSQIAEQVGVTQMQVSRLLGRTLSRLRTGLGEAAHG